MSSEHEVPLKRKADAISRLAAATSSLASSCDSSTHRSTTNNNVTTGSTRRKTGRGSDTGWTTCPLCEAQKQWPTKTKQPPKQFALGRGIAAHLNAVHAPWKQQRPKPKLRQLANDDKPRNADTVENSCSQPRGKRERTDNHSARLTNHDDPQQQQPLHQQQERQPTQQEIEDWDAQVLQLVADLEERASSSVMNNSTRLGPGVDRTGQTVTAYKTSLPLFLQHASDGNLAGLEEMVQAAGDHVLTLLTTRDRHGSVAEHWAAGGGHVKCLEYLVQMTRQCSRDSKSSAHDKETIHDASVASLQSKKMRRRDGKTSLHYAARNGHVSCIEYLLREQLYAVNVASGDGTTPFHLACFGGHLAAARVLLDHGADAAAANDWGCTTAHWLAMSTTSSNGAEYREFCRWIQGMNVSFVRPQKQGHSAVHKAAQRKNRVMLEWLAEPAEVGGAGLSDKDKVMAGSPDAGGHRPSEIWTSVGGDETTASWMRSMNW